MTNNDIIRRLRYTFDFDDNKMMALFRQAGQEASRSEISDWLKQDTDPDFKNCSDVKLALFLNGLIIENRGKKDGETPEPEKKLNNNIILKKIKIAMNLKAEEILALVELAEFKMSKHELSAFFRKPGHKHYRECKDQILRHLLRGMQMHYRDKKPLNQAFQW